MNKKLFKKTFLTIVLSVFAILLYNNVSNAADMSLKATIYNGKVDLSWNNIYSDIDGYELYNGEDLVITKSAYSTSHTVYNLSTSKIHTLKIRAFKYDYSNYSNENDYYYGYYGDYPKEYGDFTYIDVFPSVVSNVKTSLVDRTAVKVTWDLKLDVTGYKIYRSTSKNSGYKQIKTITSKNTNSYTDKGLSKAKTYYYKVVPYLNDLGKECNGGDSNISTIKTFNDSKITGVGLKTEAGSTISYVSWKKSSTVLDGYEIYRATSKKGKYKKVKTVNSVNTTSCTDTKLTKGKTYYYKVRGFKKFNGKKYYTKFSDVKSIKVSYIKRNTKIPYNGYTYYGDKVTVKSISMKYKKNSGSKAVYQVKMKLKIQSRYSNNTYFTIYFYDKNDNYVGYTNLEFDRKAKTYTKTLTWDKVKIPKKAVSYTIR